MNPNGVHRVFQKIRNTRNELNAEEKWARTVDHRDTRTLMLDQVFFWRRVMDYAEKIAQEKS